MPLALRVAPDENASQNEFLHLAWYDYYIMASIRERP